LNKKSFFITVDSNLKVNTVKSDHFKDMDIGSLIFQSPAIVDNNEKYSKEDDIWALGIILYFLIELRYPYANIDNPVLLKKEIMKSKLIKDGKVDKTILVKIILYYMK
jgi:serine/threonine protein kinase